jgi:hypothetical protein
MEVLSRDFREATPYPCPLTKRKLSNDPLGIVLDDHSGCTQRSQVIGALYRQ